MLPDDLKLWLSDREPKTLQKAAHLADQYVALHKSVQRDIIATQPSQVATSKQSVCVNTNTTNNTNKQRFASNNSSNARKPFVPSGQSSNSANKGYSPT
jgi:hypothetical protein